MRIWVIEITKAWSFFIDITVDNPDSNNYLKQVKGLKLRNMGEPEDFRFYNYETHARCLPLDVLQSIDINDSISLLNFLIQIGKHWSPMSNEELELWTLDITSLVNICITYQNTKYSLYCSQFKYQLIELETHLLAKSFWDNLSDPYLSMQDIADFYIGDERTSFLETLKNATKRYFQIFQDNNISKETIMNKLYYYEKNLFPYADIGISLEGKRHGSYKYEEFIYDIPFHGTNLGHYG